MAMAASLLLRQGLAGGLKTVLLEAGVFRGLASTVSLSAESGKNEKGLPPNPKKQSPPKSPCDKKLKGPPAKSQQGPEALSPSSHNNVRLDMDPSPVKPSNETPDLTATRDRP